MRTASAKRQSVLIKALVLSLCRLIQRRRICSPKIFERCWVGGVFGVVLRSGDLTGAEIGKGRGKAGWFAFQADLMHIRTRVRQSDFWQKCQELIC
jgi:hypothetical protein